MSLLREMKLEQDPALTAPASAVVSAPPGYSAPAADVLALVAGAGAPLPHPALLRELMERGWAKEKARAAITTCQTRGWIEHDLMNGYVLASAAGIADDDQGEKQL